MHTDYTFGISQHQRQLLFTEPQKHKRKLECGSAVQLQLLKLTLLLLLVKITLLMLLFELILLLLLFQLILLLLLFQLTLLLLLCKLILLLLLEQGTDDLEEAMSERLQELPPPMGRQTAPKQDAEGFSFPQDMDTDAVEPSQVQ